MSWHGRVGGKQKIHIWFWAKGGAVEMAEGTEDRAVAFITALIKIICPATEVEPGIDSSTFAD